MADATRTKANVRPLTGYSSRKATAGAALEGGQPVYLDGANGWKAAEADGAQDVASARGVVGSPGDTANGKEFDLITRGPVTGFSGLTPGADYYISATAGEIAPLADLSAGQFPCRIGYAESPTVLFVEPAPVGAALT